MSSTTHLPLRHLRLGWWTLAISLLLGLALEALHGFKIGWYLDVGNETRRTMLTLAHTHGTLIALVNIAVGLTARFVERSTVSRFASCASIGGILLPAGFFLGAFGIHGGDPGIGVLLAPLGGVSLLLAVLSIALAFSRRA